MRTIQLRAFLETQHEVAHDVLQQRQSVNFDPRVLREAMTITDLNEAIREEVRVIPRSVCKDVMNNFVLRLKKCTELNGGHLGQML